MMPQAPFLFQWVLPRVERRFMMPEPSGILEAEGFLRL
jgi:hypothetical protein